MIKNKNLVTIAIPIYNAEAYLAYAIQSVINQTYTNWELLLMCDGSSDQSTSIAVAYAENDSRIKVVDDGINRGLIYRLNQSIAMAKGKYYARMDADDIMVVSRIAEQVEFLNVNPEVDVCGTSIMTIDNENRIVGSGFNEGKVNRFIHPTVMGRISWFKSNPYADWALRAEDFELWTRTAATSKFYALGKPLLFYREFGVPTFQKYFFTQCTLLKIFYRYKHYSRPFSWYISNTIKTFCKIIVYALFAIVDRLDYLVSRRKRKPLPAKLCLTENDLGKAINKNSRDHKDINKDKKL